MVIFRNKIAAGLAALMVPGLVFAGPVNINTADAVTLAKELAGVGKSKAEAIVAWREVNGVFGSPSDLRKVKGIGAQVLELNRGNILVEVVDNPS